MEQAIEIIELKEELQRTKLLLQNCNGDIIRADRELASLREQLKDAKQEIANLSAIGSLMVDGDVEVNLANEVYKLKGQLNIEQHLVNVYKVQAEAAQQRLSEREAESKEFIEMLEEARGATKSNSSNISARIEALIHKHKAI